MNRTELTAAIAAQTEVERDLVGRVLDALDEKLLAVVRAGDDLRWPGLLTVEVVDRPARSGHNPQTGEPMEIPAGKSVRIRAGSRLKSAAQS